MLSANMQAQQRNFPYPIPPQVKAVDFNIPERISQYDGGDNTGQFHTAGN